MPSVTDLLIILQPNSNLNKESFIQSVDQLGNVIGSELYVQETSIMYRTAMEYDSSIHLLDVTICTYRHWIDLESTSNHSTLIYGDMELQQPNLEFASEFSVNMSLDQINEIWFKYFITIKKFVRRDHLIGFHLLFDLIREYLVIAMIERDEHYGTNIHRHGYAEQLPDRLKLAPLDSYDLMKILDYVDQLAKEYDGKLLTHIDNYQSKYSSIGKYIEQSKQHAKSI